MSVLELKTNSDSEQAWRAALKQRPRVLEIVRRKYGRRLGSAEVEDAVDKALGELLASGASPQALLRMWPRAALLRASDAAKSGRVKRRDSSSPEQHDPGQEDHEREQLREELGGDYRALEMLEALQGDERRWAQAILDAPSDRNRRRHLAPQLGWSIHHYKRVAASARAQLVSFISARADGTLCARRQAVLGAFAAMHLQGEGELDAAEYRRTLLHVGGCPMCKAQWRQHERALLDARHALAPAPLLLAALVAAKLKAASTLASARARLGVSGAGAGGGGVAAALGSKGAAVICAGALCAAAGAGALVSSDPAILPLAAQSTVAHPTATRHRARHPRRIAHPQPAHAEARRHQHRALARAHTTAVVPIGAPASEQASASPPPAAPQPTYPPTTAPATPVTPASHHTSALNTTALNSTAVSARPRRAQRKRARSRAHRHAHANLITPGDLTLAESSPAPRHATAAAPAAATPSASVVRSASVPASPPASSSSTSSSSSSNPAASSASVPGDLPVSSSSSQGSRSSHTASSTRVAPAQTKQPICTPGDLTC